MARPHLTNFRMERGDRVLEPAPRIIPSFFVDDPRDKTVNRRGRKKRARNEDIEVLAEEEEEDDEPSFETISHRRRPNARIVKKPRL